MSYPYSLIPGHVTLQSNWTKTGSHYLTEQRFAGAVQQKELLNNQKAYSLKLDRNRQAGYDRLLFGPNALSTIYPLRESSRTFATSEEERDMVIGPFRAQLK
jgi:hypothetical protein